MAVLSLARRIYESGQTAEKAAETGYKVAKANQSAAARAATPGNSATDDLIDAVEPTISRRSFTQRLGQQATNAAGRRAVNEGTSRTVTTIIAPFALASRATLAVVVGFREMVAVVSSEVDSLFVMLYDAFTEATQPE